MLMVVTTPYWANNSENPAQATRDAFGLIIRGLDAEFSSTRIADVGHHHQTLMNCAIYDEIGIEIYHTDSGLIACSLTSDVLEIATPDYDGCLASINCPVPPVAYTTAIDTQLQSGARIMLSDVASLTLPNGLPLPDTPIASLERCNWYRQEKGWDSSIQEIRILMQQPLIPWDEARARIEAVIDDLAQ